MPKITSRDNQKLKFARKVRDRREKNFIFVEGTRLAVEFLKSDLKIKEVFFTPDFLENEKNNSLLEQINLKTQDHFEIPAQIFKTVSDTENSQGIILIGEKPENIFEKTDLKSSVFQKFPLLVLLHQINNPNNLGAILRTCEAVGVGGVILTKNSADVFSPKAVRSAMGASFRLKFWTDADFAEVLQWANENGLLSICADVKAEKSFWNVDWKKPRLLIFGSEAHGLTESEREKIDEEFLIPMENQVESLNLAVSCAVVLYEAKRIWSEMV